MVFRRRVLMWTWEDAEQSSCRSVSPILSCIANLWDGTFAWAPKRVEYETFRFYFIPRYLAEPKSPHAVEITGNKERVCPRVLCQTCLLDAIAIHLCAEIIQLFSLPRYINSNRCGLIGMRSPPGVWQKSVPGSTSLGVWEGMNLFSSFYFIFSRSFPPATLLDFVPYHFTFFSCEGGEDKLS